MDLPLLRSFVTMGDAGNVGRAAQRLYIRQPAPSKIMGCPGRHDPSLAAGIVDAGYR